jgi:hypothetical protein
MGLDMFAKAFEVDRFKTFFHFGGEIINDCAVATGFVFTSQELIH